MKEVKVFLVDDHEIFRAGLKGLIENDSTMRVVAEAQDGQDVLCKLKGVRCDVVVLDLFMPRMDGLTALKKIHKAFPKLKVVVLTMQEDLEHFKHAMINGAAGYVLKDDAYEQLAMAISLIMKGKQFISPSIASLLAERFIRSERHATSASLNILTKREKQILKLIAGGLANKNIAVKLKISIRTVETHRANLTSKLGIKTTAGIVKFAMTQGLV
ncbi:MAG: response regulator transcription factor [Candidatus Omnitrophica bacterium]|nr:response regulator transcription factor [Candidatus Omnitrophota bacterium]